MLTKVIIGSVQLRQAIGAVPVQRQQTQLRHALSRKHSIQVDSAKGSYSPFVHPSPVPQVVTQAIQQYIIERLQVTISPAGKGVKPCNTAHCTSRICWQSRIIFKAFLAGEAVSRYHAGPGAGSGMYDSLPPMFPMVVSLRPADHKHELV